MAHMILTIQYEKSIVQCQTDIVCVCARYLVFSMATSGRGLHSFDLVIYRVIS